VRLKNGGWEKHSLRENSRQEKSMKKFCLILTIGVALVGFNQFKAVADPTILPLLDLTVALNEIGLTTINLIDPDISDPSLLTTTATSSNPTLITDANLFIGGTGFQRQMSLLPELNQQGESDITVTVSDPQGHKASTQFKFTVGETSGGGGGENGGNGGGATVPDSTGSATVLATLIGLVGCDAWRRRARTARSR
jgi:hypothetical protein